MALGCQVRPQWSVASTLLLISFTGFLAPALGQVLPSLTGNPCSTVGVLFADDFNSTSTSSQRWATNTGTVGTACGSLGDGNSAWFAGSEATRELISKPLDLTKADTMAIQFGRGTCSPYTGISRYTVRVQYAVGDQGSYITIYSFLASGTVSSDASFSIPTGAQASNVKIRIYQASFTSGGTAWGVDNIFIGYSSTHGFFDSFTSLFTNCNWFFPTGGVARPACGSTSSVLDMGNNTLTPGVRVLSSRMFQTSCSDPACGRTMMFDLRMLCYGIASATTDELSTVLTLTVHGAGSRVISSQTYKAGSYATWRRVAYTLPLVTATRVVLEQTAGALSTTHWAVDNFYLGSGCTTFCNGRGFCASTGTCQCEAGYTGSDCSTETGPLPSSLADNFDAPLTSSKNWVVYAGVTAGTACTTITDGKAAQFNMGSNRVLETRDLHLTVYSVISYYFLYPPSPCRRPTSSSYQVTLQYSLTAGLSWVVVRTMSYTYNYQRPVQYRLAIPTAAVGKPVRFRWLQNIARGDNQDVALIDNVFIGTPVNASQAPIVDNLDNVAEGSGTIVATSIHGSNVSYCNSLGGTMFFNPTSTSVYSAPAQLLLHPIQLPAGVDNVVQFDLYMGGCSATTITTAYSYITLGVAVSAASSFNRVKTLAVQDYSNYWHRVAGTLPASTYGGRSIWISIFQTENEASLSTGLSWAVDNLYVGVPCPNLCSGRGYCQSDVTCKCDTGFSGNDCSNITEAYPTFLKESFSGSKVGPLLQNPVAMALTTSYCGLSISSGGYLSGYAKSYVRKLETGPLDLSSVLPLIQYRFQNGYGSYSNLASTCRYPTSTSYQVYFQYSTDNGLNWVTLTTISYGSYRSGQDFSILLKHVARTKAVRLRWYQGSMSTPIQLSVSNQVWSVDNIAIGSTVTQSTDGTEFIDNFNSFTGNGWSSLASAVASTYCSSTSPVLLFQTSITQGTQRYATTDIFTLLLDPKKSTTENFNTIPSGWQIVGGQLSQTCGMTSSGVVFAAPGTRSLTSAPYDTSSANTLRFFITQGNSNCDGPDDANENVNLLYSVSGAAFVQLQSFPFNSAKVLTPRTVFVQLPAAAIAKSVRFQWVQPKNSGGGFDQWGIDTFVAQQLLNPVQYFVQFDLLTSCTTAATSSSSYPIVLQVANRTMASAGTTATGNWVPARSTCNRATSGTGCVSNMYAQGSTYFPSTYTGWRRITVPIDAKLALSKLVQFRWIQNKFAASSPAWAIDNVYIGWKCPNMCMGHGRCVGGTCQCDAGFGGSDCSPTGQFPFEVKENFAAGFNPAKWLLWTGNTTVSGGRCGPLQGSSSLLFSEAGEREAITVDMDSTQAKRLEFVLRMGAYVGSTCDRPDNYGETVVVQYSNNGGINWVNLWTTTCTTCWNTEPTESIVVALPTGAKTGATRFRWWQPSNGGTGQDEWRIGNIFIGVQSSNNVRLFNSFDQTDFNDCATNNCQNGATCVDRINSYTCSCVTGFTGSMCQTNINDCATNNCQNGATCEDSINSYTCSCVTGFTGSMCQTNINNCAGVVCGNNGTCFDGLNTHRCQCVAGFTGPVCENPSSTCTASSCRNGGTCMPATGSQAYTCTCVSGFTGPACQTNVDDCLPDSCSGQGTCVDGLIRFTCMCQTGYTGANCQTNIDDCVSNKCTNGAACVDGINSYTCTCHPGSTGQFCQTNINECISNPCKNSGVCVDDINSYKCSCATGFTGTRCETNVDDCVGVICMNGGSCMDLVNGKTCQCAAGYTGVSCETNINDCAGVTCQNAGTCIDSVNSYVCQCVAGFTGQNCQTNPDDCTLVSCTNGGTCVDGLASFTCQCPAGFTDMNCQTNVDDCATGPCANGGSCVDGFNSYTCTCQPGFTNAKCQTNIDDCVNTPCQNGASCVDGVNSFSCVCNPGFTGTACQTNVNACATAKCQNGASCVDGVNAYSCQCVAGFTGAMCQTNINNCLTDACMNGGTCVDGVAAYSCQCASGFTGTHCETNINDCAGVTCGNGGSCVDGRNSYCSCQAGFTGKFCQTDIVECARVTCHNGGSCMDGINSYTCICQPGFTGQLCQTDIEECATSNCHNGATCVDGLGFYTCTCAAGYTGQWCQTMINNCRPNYCANGSICVNRVGGVTCNCAPGYTGTNCGTAIDHCQQHHCQNFVKCVNRLTAYSCACVPGFTGQFCQNNVDNCAQSPCSNGGTCRGGIASFTCTCPTGYTGRACATKVTPCTKEPCQNGGTCVITAGGYYYTCQCPGSFRGSNCQTTSTSSCAGTNCGEYGKCESGQCVCSAGWTGARCDMTVESCLTLRCANGATCAETVQGIFCSCGPGWTGRLCVEVTCANQICNGRGTCQLTEGNLTTRCTCDEGYSGSSCQTYGSNTGSSTGSSSSSTIWPIIVGVVGGVLNLVVVLVAIAVFLYVRRGQKVYIVGTDGPTRVQYANPLYDIPQQGETLEEALGRTKRISTLSRTPMLSEPGEDAYEEMVEGNYEFLTDNDAAANPYMIN